MKMYIVEVPPVLNHTFPNRCACCGDVPNSSVTVESSVSEQYFKWIKTTTVKWKIPYCSICIDHCRKIFDYRSYLDMFYIFSLILFPIVVVFNFIFEIFNQIYVVILILILIPIWIVLNYQIKKIEPLSKKMMNANCCHNNISVGYVGVQDTPHYYKLPAHQFIFLNKDYAYEFAKMNAYKYHIDNNELYNDGTDGFDFTKTIEEKDVSESWHGTGINKLG